MISRVRMTSDDDLLMKKKWKRLKNKSQKERERKRGPERPLKKHR